MSLQPQQHQNTLTTHLPVLNQVKRTICLEIQSIKLNLHKIITFVGLKPICLHEFTHSNHVHIDSFVPVITLIHKSRDYLKCNVTEMWICTST